MTGPRAGRQWNLSSIDIRCELITPCYKF